MKEDKQIKKGFDITIKALTKRYPFIKGWDYNPDFNKYDVLSLIDLKIDFEELSQYTDIPMKDYWKMALKDPNNDYTSTYSLGGFFEDISPNQDEMFYQLRQKINKDARKIYSYIPDEIKRHYAFQSLFDRPDRLVPTEISIRNYLVHNSSSY